jgi:hypothetical protein
MPAKNTLFPIILLATVFAFACAGCFQSADDSDDKADGDDDFVPSDDALDDDSDSDADDGNADDEQDGSSMNFDMERAGDLWEQMGFLDYLKIEPVRSEPDNNDYTRYYFSTDDIKCYYGTAASVAVSPGSGDNVMFFMEGGGASWPGENFAVQLDWLIDMGFRNRDPENPLRDWNFVYVPYCDNSIHSGDSETTENGRLVYHHGLRHTAAAAALTKKLFPKPGNVLVTGSSAGGFGTYVGWPIVKYLYMDSKTYILSDSGVGFLNPGRPDVWETVKQSWNLHLPEDCVRCDGPIQTWLYDLMMGIDHQVRIGMFSSWHDYIISRMFLKMDKRAFEDVLRLVTNGIKTEKPVRFSRFFVAGNTHTCYDFLLPGGPNREIDGVSLYEWIGQLVNDDPMWSDHMEKPD